MSIAIQRGELKEALTGLGKVMDRRSRLPVLGCVRFMNTPQGVSMTASNITQMATYTPTNATSNNEGEFFVCLEALKQFTKGHDREMVVFERKGESVTVSNPIAGQSIEVNLDTVDGEYFPMLPSDINVTPVDPLFLVNLRKAFTCASTDEYRAILNGAALDIKPEGDHIVGTDGRRLMSLNTITLPVDACVIPTNKFLAWSSLGGDIAIGTKKIEGTIWFALQNQQWNYRIKTLEGTFPTWRQVVPQEAGKHAFNLTDDVAQMLIKVLPRLQLKPGNGISIRGKDGRVAVYGESETAGIELPNTVYQGEAAQITLDREFFIESLQAGFRRFSFDDEYSPLQAWDKTGGHFIVMPIRSAPPPQPDAPVKIQDEKVMAQDVEAPVHEPEVETTEPQPNKEKETMPETNTQKIEEPKTTNPLDLVLAAFETAKVKLHEAKSALGDIADAVKLAVREQKNQKSEIENARLLLGKLQAVKL